MATGFPDYLKTILKAAGKDDRSERAISLVATGQPTALAMIRAGRVPSTKRMRALCDALGLEFYVGPPKNEQTETTQIVPFPEKDPPPWAGDLRTDLLNEVKTLREEIQPLTPPWESETARFLQSWVKMMTGEDIPPSDPEALAGLKMPTKILEFPASLVPDVLPVPLREEVRAAAGSGAIIDTEAIMGYLPFRRDWLVKHGINNNQSSVVAVIGDSMEPNLQNRAWILVDHQRVRRLRDRIFVLGTKDGVIVKRLGKEGGGWQLVSDNRNYKPLPWPQTATVIGQVMWTGRTL